MNQKPLVYICNFLEDIIDTFRVLQDDQKQELQLQENTWFNQNELLGVLAQYPGRKKYYFVFPVSISEDYIQYACQLFQVDKTAIEIVVPAKQTQQCLGSISVYLMQDKPLINRLKNLGGFDIVSCCISDEYLRLCQTFKGHANVLDSVKWENWQKIKRFTTKQGIREMVDKLNDPQIFMPKGKILYKSLITFDDAINQISQGLKKQTLVIKSQKFFAGKGVLIIRKEQVSGLTHDQIKEYVKEKMKKPFWQCSDLVIEEYIDVNPDIGPPCYQIYLSDDGNVQTVWVSAMIMEDQKNFIGIQSGLQLFKKQVKDKLNYAAIALGKIYFQLGYRGYINIDFLVDKADKVYVGQSNVRRSASLFIHNFVSHLHGVNYQKSHYIMTHDINSNKLIKMKLSDILKILQQLGINYNKQKQTGIIVSSQKCFESGLLEIFSMSRTREQGFSLGNKLRKIFE